MPSLSYEDVVDYLDENEVEWEEKDGVIYILDAVEEAEISIEDDDSEEIEESVDIEAKMLNEVAAKRKIVVRKGRKKILFKCAPGFKKKGPRSCVRRATGQLRKMKLTAKRSARKARGKRSQAKRKRKLSLRKRLTFGLRPRKKR
jgi:dihydropteroate synthase